MCMSLTLYSQVPNERRVLIKRGSEKIPKFNKRGDQNKQGGWNLINGFKGLCKDGKNKSRLS